MKKYLIITMLSSFFTYAENNTLVMKLNQVTGIKVIQENNTNPEPIVSPVCNNSEFGQCTEGQSQYTSIIGADIVTWNCTNNSLSVSCSKPADLGIDGVCGSSNNTTLSSIPTQNLCNTGEASFVTETSTHYNWSCSGNEGTQTTSNGNTIDCIALKPISALNTPYVVTQSATPFSDGFAGSYSRFTSECAQYPTYFQNGNGYCIHHTTTGGGRYIGNHIRPSNNPTFYLTYDQPVSISKIAFSAFAYNYSSYSSIFNFKYKNELGQWVNTINIRNPGTTTSAQLYIKQHILPQTIIAKEFAIEAIGTGMYINLGYFKVLE